MTEEMYWKLRTLAKMLLDARLAAGAVRQQAVTDGEQTAIYDMIEPIAALRERVSDLMGQDVTDAPAS